MWRLARFGIICKVYVKKGIGSCQLVNYRPSHQWLSSAIFKFDLSEEQFLWKREPSKLSCFRFFGRKVVSFLLFKNAHRNVFHFAKMYCSFNTIYLSSFSLPSCFLTNRIHVIKYLFQPFKSLSANPTKWSNIPNSLAALKGLNKLKFCLSFFRYSKTHKKRIHFVLVVSASYPWSSLQLMTNSMSCGIMLFAEQKCWQTPCLVVLIAFMTFLIMFHQMRLMTW